MWGSISSIAAGEEKARPPPSRDDSAATPRPVPFFRKNCLRVIAEL